MLPPTEGRVEQMIKRKTVLWIGGVTMTTITITAFWVLTAADSRWDEWSKQTEALQKRLGIEEVRPVLFGSAISGNAWDAYAAAIALSNADEKLEVLVRPAERAKADPSQLAMLLAAHTETLAELHRGAHCRVVRDPVIWSRGFDGAMHSLLVLRGLSNLAVTQALAQIELGEPVAAVDTLLDSAQMGRDVAHSRVLINEIIGLAVLQISTSEAVGRNDLLERLSPAALDRFADGLAILDEHIAKIGPSLHGEAVLFARTAQNHPELFAGAGLPTFSWRYGFSSRWMFADAGLELIDRADRTVAAAEGPWSTCDSFLSTLEEELMATTNPVLSGAGVANGVLVTRFQTVARLRLLRMAIEHRRERPVPQLADPFGDTLRHETDAKGKTRFWSVGPDPSQDLLMFHQSGS